MSHEPPSTYICPSPSCPAKQAGNQRFLWRNAILSMMTKMRNDKKLHINPFTSPNKIRSIISLLTTICPYVRKIPSTQHSSQSQPQHSLLPHAPPSPFSMLPVQRNESRKFSVLTASPRNLALYAANSQKSLGKGVTTNPCLIPSYDTTFYLVHMQ